MASQQLLLGGKGIVTDPVYIDDVFSTDLYKGNGGANQIVNGIDNTVESMVWMKRRNASSYPQIHDTIRGGTNYLLTNSNGTAGTDSGYHINTFNNNGFTLQNSGGGTNANGDTYASWNFKSAPGFFDIIQYTGNDNARTISHDLGCVPGFIIIKSTSHDRNWQVYHKESGNTHALELNTTEAKDSATYYWNDTTPTSTEFSLGGGWDCNKQGYTYIAYVFAGGGSTAATARSVDFDGTGDYLEIDDHDDFHFGSGNFTVECWVKGTKDGANRNIVGQWSSGNKSWSVFWGALNQGHTAWGFKYSTDNANEYQVSDILLDDDQWHHIAVVRDGNDIKLYRDGRFRKKIDVTGVTIYNSAGACRIANDGWDSPLDCHISNVRLVKGSVVYNTSFRVPTEPLANITNTKLLCCNGTSTTSSTVTPATITAVGDPTSSTVTPFDDPKNFIFGAGKNQNIIKCGSFMGDGAAPGPEIYLGWEPQWILIKNVDKVEDWLLFDCMRGINTDADDERFYPNDSTAEINGNFINLTSTGFTVENANARINENDDKIIYVAIRRSDGYVQKLPTAGTSVFAMDYGNGSTTVGTFDSGFPVDFGIMRQYAMAHDWFSAQRMNDGKYLNLNTSAVEGGYVGFSFDSTTAWSHTSSYDSSYISWMWKRGPGFDVLNYDGNGVAGRGILHSLNAVPEMMWVKPRSNADHWKTYHKGYNAGTNPEQYTINLNDAANQWQSSAIWNDTAPTSNFFTVGTDNGTNKNGWTYLALLFSSVEGISKCGYYTGGGSDVTITTGFQPRFVIIKRTDAGSYPWMVLDTLRGWGSSNDGGNDPYMRFNQNDAQVNFDNGYYTATGFVVDAGSAFVNTTGSPSNYIYYAHA